jgi:hypothetical protein
MLVPVLIDDDWQHMVVVKSMKAKAKAKEHVLLLERNSFGHTAASLHRKNILRRRVNAADFFIHFMI